MPVENKNFVEETQQSSFNFKNYCRGVKSYKWWVIGATVVCAVLGFVGFKFVINPIRSNYAIQYNYQLAGKTDDGVTFTLIDGTTFDQYDIASKANLQAVKDSNSKFKNVDVDKIFTEGLINVKKIVETNKDDPNQTEVSFKATAKPRAFKNASVGREFLFALINYPVEISTKAIEKYNINDFINANWSNLSWVDGIKELDKQYNKINEVYTELQANFGESVKPNKSKDHLYEVYDDFLARFNVGSLTSVEFYKGKLVSNHFVDYVEGHEDQRIEELHALCNSYAGKINEYAEEYKIHETALNDLVNGYAGSISDTAYSARVLELTEKKAECKRMEEDLKDQLNFNGYYLNSDNEYEYNATYNSTIKNLTDLSPTWVEANKAFGDDLNALKVLLQAERKNAVDVCKYVYTNYSNKVLIRDSSYVTVEKSVNSYIGIIAGLLGGFLVSSVITTFVYASKGKKEE